MVTKELARMIARGVYEEAKRRALAEMEQAEKAKQKEKRP